MKLLLVDDEKFTRDGILGIIPWEDLGIDEVIIAQDGKEGLEKALSSSPDIILTDVKMPHMDGVSMSFKIREFLPNCKIIFMSGYADKEYLKSAIRLSAINYIEKPFNPKELQSTIQIAVEKCHLQNEVQNSATEMTQKLNLSQSVIRTKIATELLYPSNNNTNLEDYLRIAYPDFDRSGAWITFLVLLLENNEDKSQFTSSLSSTICDLLESRFALTEFANIFIGEKNKKTIAVHINLKNSKGQAISYSEIRNICYMLCNILKSTCKFLLATGSPVDSFHDIYQSYQSASISLQRGFFYKENAVLFYEEKRNYLIYQFSDTTALPFIKALRQHDEEAALAFIRGLIEKLRRFDGTLVSSVKNFFIQILQIIYDVAAFSGSSVFSEEETMETCSDIIWNMLFLTEIEAYILQKLGVFFEKTNAKYIQFPLAYHIRQFIDENYDNEELSLMEISSHFSISDSYACVIFKKAFNNTINQYIIDLRIEKAKYYLLNTNKKVREISEIVGYRDCNYFIRIFKKNTGITPAIWKSGEKI